MCLQELVQNPDVASLDAFDVIFSGPSVDEQIHRALGTIRVLISCNAAVQSSCLVKKLWNKAIVLAGRHRKTVQLIWCAKRLYSLQHKSDVFCHLYHMTMGLCCESMPVFSTFNTCSEAHAILRTDFSRCMQTSGVLQLLNRQLTALLHKSADLKPKDDITFRVVMGVLQRCVGIVSGCIIFLEPLQETRQVCAELAMNLIFLYHRHGADIEISHLTVMEALFASVSGNTLEFIFEHVVRLFLSKFDTCSDSHVSYLQGVVMRIMRNSSVGKRIAIRKFISDNDIIAEFARCVHNQGAVASNKHNAAICVLFELVSMAGHFDVRSAEQTLQCMLHFMTQTSDLPQADLYMLIVRQIFLKNSRPVCSDLVGELVKTLASPSFPRGIERVMSVIDPLVKNKKNSINLPTCQALVRYAMHSLIEPELDIMTWIKCLAILRTFIHQINRANLVCILEHGRVFVDAIQDWSLDPCHVCQILYIFRHIVCRLSVCKELMLDRIQDCGFVEMIRKKLNDGICTFMQEGRVSISYIKACDILFAHNILSGVQEGVVFLRFIARTIIRYCCNNRQSAVDILRMTLRTMRKLETTDGFDSQTLRLILHAITRIRFTADHALTSYAIIIAKICVFAERKNLEANPLSAASNPSEDYILERMVLFCNNVIAGVELSNTLLELSATSDKILNTLSILRVIFSEKFLAYDKQGCTLIKGSLTSLSRIRAFFANKHNRFNSSKLECAIEDFFQSYIDFV